MKCITTSTMLLISASISLLFSCKKQDNSQQPDKAGTASGTKIEQAFPGITGEVIGILSGKDSMYVEKKGGKYVWQGDIALDEASFTSFKNRKANDNARTFTNDGLHLWPSGIVYYTIQNGFTQNELNMITYAMNNYTGTTPITFVQRTNQPNYVTFVPGTQRSGLYSDYIGMKGGGQVINLESGKFLTGQIIHEIGHTIGFYHEQCRADRGNAIIVNYNNVTPNTANNIYQFQTYSETGQNGFQIEDFDFNSIMLYSSLDFSDGVHPVMTTLNGATFTGQRIQLSPGDIETAIYLYNPIFVKVTYIDTRYYDDGYTFDEQGDVYVSFYKDAGGTIPLTNLNLPININIRHNIFSDCSANFTSTAEQKIIPAGAVASSIYVGSYAYHNSYDANENPISCSSTSTNVISGGGYKVL